MTTATKLPMKLSDRTINLLKNFATINQSILFKQGKSLRTISVMKNILAEANVDEDFPQAVSYTHLTLPTTVFV